MLNKTGYIINGVTSSGVLFGKQNLKIFDKVAEMILGELERNYS